MIRPTTFLVTLGALGVIAAPVAAQGRSGKRYAVSNDRAISVTREVLVARGYEVVRIENKGADRIVWYRAGSRGRRRGEGPLQRLTIRRVEDRIVFLNTPGMFLGDLDIRLRRP